MPPLDTNPDLQKMYDDLWKNLSLQERFRKGMILISQSRLMMWIGFRQRYQSLPESELKKIFVKKIYNLEI